MDAHTAEDYLEYGIEPDGADRAAASFELAAAAGLMFLDLFEV